MNILFFITPKNNVCCVEDTYSLRQTIEKMEYHRYTAVPMLNVHGIYIGTITEGDLLRVIKDKLDLNLRGSEDIKTYEIPRRWNYESININCDIEDLFELASKQNFVPVVDDDGVFIGLIKRSDIIEYFYKHGAKTAGQGE